jgi:CheY-like chemotaxis protein
MATEWSGIEVLVVEDDPNDAELTQRALHALVSADRVLHVDDGVKALDILFGERGLAGRPGASLPRMILLDLKLPKVSGLEVARRIKSDARTSFIPVVVFTSSREERDISESYRVGVNSYLVKPMDFDDYIATVREATHYWSALNQLPLLAAPAKGHSRGASGPA